MFYKFVVLFLQLSHFMENIFFIFIYYTIKVVKIYAINNTDNRFTISIPSSKDTLSEFIINNLSSLLRRYSSNLDNRNDCQLKFKNLFIKFNSICQWANWKRQGAFTLEKATLFYIRILLSTKELKVWYNKRRRLKLFDNNTISNL